MAGSRSSNARWLWYHSSSEPDTVSWPRSIADARRRGELSCLMPGAAGPLVSTVAPLRAQLRLQTPPEGRGHPALKTTSWRPSGRWAGVWAFGSAACGRCPPSAGVVRVAGACKQPAQHRCPRDAGWPIGNGSGTSPNRSSRRLRRCRCRPPRRMGRSAHQTGPTDRKGRTRGQAGRSRSRR